MALIGQIGQIFVCTPSLAAEKLLLALGGVLAFS